MATHASYVESWINGCLETPNWESSDHSDIDSFTPSSEKVPGKFSGHGTRYSKEITAGNSNAFSHAPHQIGKPNSRKMGHRKGPPKAAPPPRQKATVQELAEENA